MTGSADLEAVVRSRDTPVGLTTEHRFPLGLTPELPEIWQLYESSKTLSWDPEDPTFLADWVPDRHGDPLRQAAALIWSRRAWVEFPGMAESEALLVRFCLEPDRAVDAKYCLSCRAVEKARVTDACRVLAESFDRYVAESPSADLVDVLEGDRVRWALHTEVDLDALVVGSLCVEALIDLRLWEAAAQATVDPTALGLVEHVLVDKRREVSFGWAYLDSRLAQLEVVPVEAIAAAADRVARDELRGRRVTAMLAAGEGKASLIDAQERVATSGLGAVSAADEVEVLRAAIGECRSSLGQRGLVMANAGHDEHGRF